MDKAASLGFPLRVLTLGMMVHQAARSLRAGEFYSEAVLPECSILAGCGLSVAWTRGVLHGLLDEAHRQHRPANYIIESWVDDLASVVQGTAEQCIAIAVNTGRKIGGPPGS